MQGNKVAITGVGETAYLRASQASLLEMTVEACLLAIADAGLVPADIDGFVCNRNIHSSDELGYAIGVKDRAFTAVTDVVGGTAPAGQALILAQLAIEAGLAKHVIVPYGIQSTRPGGVYDFHAREPLKAGLEMPVGWFGQPSYFAAMANRYAYEYGMTEEQQAAVAITFRKWASLNPRAQRRELMDLEAYRKTAMISTPLRVADCCLTTDGAAAYIVSSVEHARDRPHPIISVSGVGVSTNNFPHSIVFTQNPDVLAVPGKASAAKAYAMADMSAADVDLAQIYDGFSISALVQTEMLGLCETGEAARFFHAGHAMPGGRMPINTSGGHMSGGYMPGISLIIEGVRQLRGQEGERQVPDARVCAVTGFGGNSHSTALLTRT